MQTNSNSIIIEIRNRNKKNGDSDNKVITKCLN